MISTIHAVLLNSHKNKIKFKMSGHTNITVYRIVFHIYTNRDQSIGVLPCEVNNSLHLEKCLQPKNPR